MLLLLQLNAKRETVVAKMLSMKLSLLVRDHPMELNTDFSILPWVKAHRESWSTTQKPGTSVERDRLGFEF